MKDLDADQKRILIQALAAFHAVGMLLITDDEYDDEDILSDPIHRGLTESFARVPNMEMFVKIGENIIAKVKGKYQEEVGYENL